MIGQSWPELSSEVGLAKAPEVSAKEDEAWVQE